MMTGKMKMETVEMVRMGMMLWKWQSNDGLCEVTPLVVLIGRRRLIQLTVMTVDGMIRCGLSRVR